MKRIFYYIIVLFIGSNVILLNGCSSPQQPPPPQWDQSFDEIVGTISSDNSDTLNVDIYVDATISMEGYTQFANSNYIKFLGDIEAAAGYAWAKTDIKFFKFGTWIKPVDRNGFLEAKRSSFYHDTSERKSGSYIYQETLIDNVIDQTDQHRVSIVITDLFQTNEDVTAIVNKIQDRCFNHNIYVGILGIKSQYKGRIYDCPSCPFDFSSKDGDESTYRPFYAIMFGDPSNIAKLYEVLTENSHYMDREHFYVISPYLIKSYQMSNKKFDHQPNVFFPGIDRGQELSLRTKQSNGTVSIEFAVEKYPGVPPLSSENLELIVWKRSLTNPKDTQQVTNEIKLNHVEINPSKITAMFDINLPPPKGWHTYKIYLKLPQSGGIVIPEWVQEFSSENPTRNVDSNKTLNLEMFLNHLTKASLAIRQPYVVKSFITIEKLK